MADGVLDEAEQGHHEQHAAADNGKLDDGDEHNDAPRCADLPLCSAYAQGWLFWAGIGVAGCEVVEGLVGREEACARLIAVVVGDHDGSGGAGGGQ